MISSDAAISSASLPKTRIMLGMPAFCKIDTTSGCGVSSASRPPTSSARLLSTISTLMLSEYT